MASETDWDRDEPMPPIIGVEREGMGWYANPLAWCELDEPQNDDREDDFDAHTYLHRDAARAWQAFRDFLNGTPEQWQRRMVMHGRASFAEGATINPLMAEMYERMGGAR